MATPSNLYPLSTADGKYIPLDVIRPLSAVPIDFVTGSGSTAVSCPATCQILMILASQDAILTFAASSASAAALVDRTIVADTILVPSNSFIFVSPPIEKLSFSLRGISTAGTALINFLDSWAGLALSSQFTRR